jgi:leader peptidase (prepilin peptidase) / N-methyltransferase
VLQLTRDERNLAPAMRSLPSDPNSRPLVQYGGFGLVGLTVVAASALAAPGLSGIFGAGLGLLMVAVAFIDARHFIIPNSLTLAAFGLGLLAVGVAEGWDGIAMALMRGAIVALSFLAVRIGYHWLRGRHGIGLGDVKLAGVAGIWLAWTLLPIAIEIAALAALSVYTLRWLSGQRIRRLTRVPFGLFFAPAIWLSWLLEIILARLI